MDLKTTGLLIAFITGLLGLVGSVGAYFESVAHTQDAISQLQREQDSLHGATTKRIDDLRASLKSLDSRVAVLEKAMAANDEKLKNTVDRLERMGQWVKEVSDKK